MSIAVFVTRIKLTCALMRYLYTTCTPGGLLPPKQETIAMNTYNTKDWYYVQTFKKNVYRPMNTIVFAKSKTEATEKAQAWAAKSGQDGEMHLYRNNYKRAAAAMVSAGNYIA